MGLAYAHKPSGSKAAEPAKGKASALRRSPGPQRELAEPESAGPAAQDLWPEAQPSLRVGAVDTPQERQAERIAAAVTAGPLPAPRSTRSRLDEQILPAGAGPRPAQRRCAACAEEEERLVQRRSRAAVRLDAGLGLPVLRPRGGAPLPRSVRATMESRMGFDFSPVRVHVGAEAGALADRIGAEAFTVDRDIYFGRGQYRPHTRQGQHLLAHELVHTAQQGAARAMHSRAAPLATVRPGLVQRRLLSAAERRGDPHELKQAKRRSGVLWWWVQKLAGEDLDTGPLRRRWAEWVLLLAENDEPNFVQLYDPEWSTVLARLHAILAEPDPASAAKAGCPDPFDGHPGKPCDEFGRAFQWVVKAALRHGRRLVDGAIARLPGRADPADESDTRAAFEALLAPWTDANLAVVRSLVSAARGVMNGLEFICHGTPAADGDSEATEGAADNGCDGDVAYVRSGVSSTQVHLCAPFFCENSGEQALTLVHEAVHLADTKGVGPDVRSFRPEFFEIAALPAGYGVRNPDSLALFVAVAAGEVDRAALADRRARQEVYGFEKAPTEPIVRAVMALARAWVASGTEATNQMYDDDLRRLARRHGLDLQSVRNHLAALDVSLDVSSGADPFRLEMDRFAGHGPGPFPRETLDELTAEALTQLLRHSAVMTARRRGSDQPAAIPVENLIDFLRDNFYTYADARFLVLPQPAR